MVEPFIRNHQFNYIKKQAGILQHATKTVVDPKVVEAIKYSTVSKVVEIFPHVTDSQKVILERISTLKMAEDFQQYLCSLEPYMVEFPQVTDKQTKKLFSKNKKLKIPDFSLIDHHYVTYLSWLDISTNRLFFIYNLNGEITGFEGKYTHTNKKDLCALCHGVKEVALVTAISKSKPANFPPDYYKAVGNYMCINSQECNKNITDVTYLESFIQNVIG